MSASDPPSSRRDDNVVPFPTPAGAAGAPVAESAPRKESEPRKPLTPEARRALAEAAERRARQEAAAQAAPVEIGGRDGPEPARYGDWEIKGIACDF